ncbi:MAG: hypothetical protein WCF54_10715 [Terracidiphilus sp.]
MKQFDLPHLIGIHGKLTVACAALNSNTEILNEERITTLLEFLKEIESYCEKVHFHHAASKAFGLNLDVERSPENFTGIKLAAHLEGIRADMDVCMFGHKFIQVVGDGRDYLDAKSLFGESVVKAFPKTLGDVQNAGDCIAVDLGTAAVFHLMHVAEWGLRALAVDVGLSDVVVDKKTKKTIPIEFSEWEKILSQLPEKIEAKILPMPRGDGKQKAQEFYYSASMEIRGFKDAWRNHVMHTRRSYTREDALAVFSHVQRFMQSLAAYGLKESVI